MFKKVLIPTDLSMESDNIFRYAQGLKRLGLNEVVAIHGIDASSAEIPYMPQEIKEREGRLLEKGKEFFGTGVLFRLIVEEGTMMDLKIVEVAERENISLILMGSHGKSPWEEVLYGSISEKVGRKARIPVFFIKYELLERISPEELSSATFNKILLPTDLSPSSDKALEAVKRLRPLEVTILYVSKKSENEMHEEGTEEGKTTIESKLELIKEDLGLMGIRTVTLLRYGNVLEEILKASEDASSVVMASHRKGILKEWLAGSISLNVARKAAVPVVLTHDDDIAV